MGQKLDFKAEPGLIVRNVQNNDLYKYLGGTKWVNLRTGNEGEVPEEKVPQIFLLNVEATYFWNEWEGFGDMIRRLNLKIDKTINNV